MQSTMMTIQGKKAREKVRGHAPFGDNWSKNLYPYRDQISNGNNFRRNALLGNPSPEINREIIFLWCYYNLHYKINHFKNHIALMPISTLRNPFLAHAHIDARDFVTLVRFVP